MTRTSNAYPPRIRNLLPILFSLMLLVASPLAYLNVSIGSPAILALSLLVLASSAVTRGLGGALYSQALLVLPVISLTLYGSRGLVQPLFNASTGLIDTYFTDLLFGLSTFLALWSLLLSSLPRLTTRIEARYLSAAMQVRSRNSALSTTVFSVISLAASYVYRPGLPGGAYRSVDFNLLPGNAWNSLALLAYFFVVYGRRSMLRTATLILVPAWFLLHFARVELLGLAIVFVLHQKKPRTHATRSAKNLVGKINTSMVLLASLFIFAYLGLIRGHGLAWNPEILLSSFSSLLNYPTVQDVVYAGSAALDYVHQVGTHFTLLEYWPQLVPSFIADTSFESASRLVRDVNHTNYGMLIIGEFYLNFGWAGFLLGPLITLLYIIVPLALISRVFGRLGFAFGYYIVLISLARMFWYGFIYYLKPLLIIAPFLLLLFIVLAAYDRSMKLAFRRSGDHNRQSRTANRV